MLKKFAPLVLLLAVCTSTFAQQPDAEGSLVKWMTIEEAMEKVKTQPRPIIMDFYTSWCGWCKRMMATTYANPGLAQYINANFYPVKFDAEGKDTVTYLGQTYAPTTTEGRATHPLAVKLLGSKLVYPTTLFMNNYDKKKDEFQFNMLASGYLDDKKIEPILVFTLENVFRNSQYEDYKAQFDKAFYDSVAAEQMKKVNWLTPKQVFNGKELNTKKKTAILIHTEWCNACKVMKRATFIDSAVYSYISKKYDLVDFNPEITDTLTFKGQQFTNPRSPQMPFHQLAMALTRNNFVLPTLAIMDENGNLLDAISFYVPPKFANDVLRFYGDDIFKTKSWQEYTGIKPAKEEKKSN